MYLEVLIPFAVCKTFLYSFDCIDGDLFPGVFVEVPFRKRRFIALVVACDVMLPTCIPSSSVRKVIRILSKVPALKAHYIEFIRWVSRYYMAPIGMIFKMSQCELLYEPDFFVLTKTGELYTGRDKSLHKVIDCLLHANRALSAEEITYVTKVRKTTLYKMCAAQFIFIPDRIIYQNDPLKVDIVLSDDQKLALDLLLASPVSLLNGITGSGKTEVYLRALQSVLNHDLTAQALIMLPEISLTTHLVRRFKNYLGESNVVEWHSGLGIAQRTISLQKIVFGVARIVVGARSALFIPYCNLKLIIIDEEHDSSYKQSSGVKYNARDMACVLAKIMQIKLILVSATPSLETVHNVKFGRIKQALLSKRFASAALPDLKAIDMSGKKQILSEELIVAIKLRIAKNEQTLLFINRRGYAPIMLCSECGFKVKCINCSIWLVYHKKLDCLMCHYCGYKTALTNDCSNCAKKGVIFDLGLGIEKLESEVKKYFTEAIVAVLSSDVNVNAASIIESILNNQVDIILGTQIIAKGYHFPQLTLVGVINADHGLSCGDLRASEHTYQLLNQVAGRCGRESEKKGEVMIQSYNPNSKFMQSLLSYDKEGFYRCELDDRKSSGMPPYTRLASVIITDRYEDKAMDLAKFVASNIPSLPKDKIVILGPTPAPIFFLKRLYRYRFLVIAKPGQRIQPYLHKWLNDFIGNRGIEVDIDPINFL